MKIGAQSTKPSLICVWCCVLLSFFLVMAVVAQAQSRGGEIIRVVPTGPDSLDPAKAVAAESHRIIFNLYDTLLTADEHGHIGPHLANDWQVSEDGTVYTFYLRDDVTFHNGRRMTAEDVRDTYQRLIDNADVYRGAQDWQGIQAQLHVIDDFTLEIRLAEANAPFLAILAAPGASIVPREAVENLDLQPIGTGPFTLVEWVEDEKVVIQRFEDYWMEGRPYLDRVTFRIIPEWSTALEAFDQNEADVIQLDPVHAASTADNPEMKIVTGSSNAVVVLAMNQARSPWNNSLVRRALAHGIERNELIQGVVWGYGTPVFSGLSTGSEYFAQLDNPYPFSVETAKRLLSEAGYSDGITATVVVPEIYETHIVMAELLQKQLARIGVDLVIETIDWERWLDEVYAERNYDLTIIGLTGKIDPHHELRRYESTYYRNFMNFQHEEYDELIRLGARTTDPDLRMDRYQRAQEIMASELPALFLMVPQEIVGVRSDIDGWTVYPTYVDDLRNVSTR